MHLSPDLELLRRKGRAEFDTGTEREEEGYVRVGEIYRRVTAGPTNFPELGSDLIGFATGPVRVRATGASPLSINPESPVALEKRTSSDATTSPSLPVQTVSLGGDTHHSRHRRPAQSVLVSLGEAFRWRE